MEYSSSTRSATLEPDIDRFADLLGGVFIQCPGRRWAAQCRHAGLAGIAQCRGDRQELFQRLAVDAQAAARCATVEGRSFALVCPQIPSQAARYGEKGQREEKTRAWTPQ